MDDSQHILHIYAKYGFQIAKYAKEFAKYDSNDITSKKICRICKTICFSMQKTVQNICSNHDVQQNMLMIYFAHILRKYALIMQQI
jgi:hypothetical protein